MRKYRILQEGKKFYPQEKSFWLFGWEYLDNWIAGITWSKDRRHNSVCERLSDAEEVIEKRINFLKKEEVIIHEYKLKEK